MAIDVDSVTLPACWATALINGDDSSFSLNEDGGEAELAAIDAALALLTKEGWRVVGVVRDDAGEPCESWFTWSYDVYGGIALGGYVFDYVIVRDIF